MWLLIRILCHLIILYLGDLCYVHSLLGLNSGREVYFRGSFKVTYLLIAFYVTIYVTLDQVLGLVASLPLDLVTLIFSVHICDSTWFLYFIIELKIIIAIE